MKMTTLMNLQSQSSAMQTQTKVHLTKPDFLAQNIHIKQKNRGRDGTTIKMEDGLKKSITDFCKHSDFTEKTGIRCRSIFQLGQVLKLDRMRRSILTSFVNVVIFENLLFMMRYSQTGRKDWILILTLKMETVWIGL